MGLTFAAAAGFAFWRKPRVKRDYLGFELEDLFQRQSATGISSPQVGWLCRPTIPLKVDLRTNFDAVYSDGVHLPVMLLLAQNGGQTGFLQIHRPETCYTAGGYQISPITPHAIAFGSKTINANRMDASAGGPTEHVIYWTRVGNRIPNSWEKQKLAVFEQNLEGVVPDGSSYAYPLSTMIQRLLLKRSTTLFAHF